jgi:hypothetical protein
MSEKENPQGNDPSREEVRKQIDSILSRARTDEAFGRQLNADPEKALREAGLHGRAVKEVAGEFRSFAAGTRPDTQRMCDFTTCWISACDHWGTFVTSPK